MVEGVNRKVIKGDYVGPLHSRSLEFKSFKLIPIFPYLGIKAMGIYKRSYGSLANVNSTSWKPLTVYMVAGIKSRHWERFTFKSFTLISIALFRNCKNINVITDVSPTNQKKAKLVYSRRFWNYRNPKNNGI